uniref:Uncharacterized protein conserved in bacteria n=1 Tax=uncultured Rhodospirillales bacterium HF0070_31K06 TaxID=710786 RepID=E0XSP9_9PROT|nr:uncharacterized protein conserved in bacteria [uncultured Rhodospirillales bacterium HF0070_31K06]
MAMTVGRYLKTERESQGQDLTQVAEMLRVHRSYLQAIEDGEIDQLPGPTYAVGFVRAYADHLGLDRNKVAERFKEEGKIPKQRAELILPTPLPEGQIPSLAVLLIAAVLLSVAYGGWVFVSSPDGDIAEMVPALSDRFAALVDDGEGKDEEKVKAVQAAAPAEMTTESESDKAKQEIFAPPPTVSSESDSAPPKPEAMDTASTESVSEAVLGTASAAAEKPMADPETEPRLANTTATSDASSTAAAETKFASVVTTAENNSATSAIAAPTVVVAPTALQTSEGDGPRVYGESSDGSRITIRTIVDSWVEVRDGEGELLFTQVLREGDQYHVPDRLGLTLVTGNAGGLEFAVDGEKVSEIGPLGAVRRNVRLEPQALKEGTASNF